MEQLVKEIYDREDIIKEYSSSYTVMQNNNKVRGCNTLANVSVSIATASGSERLCLSLEQDVKQRLLVFYVQ